MGLALGFDGTGLPAPRFAFSATHARNQIPPMPQCLTNTLAVRTVSHGLLSPPASDRLPVLSPPVEQGGRWEGEGGVDGFTQGYNLWLEDLRSIKDSDPLHLTFHREKSLLSRLTPAFCQSEVRGLDIKE